MSEVILLSSFLTSALILLYRQRVDLFLLAFASNTIYGWQILAGEIWVPPYNFPVTENSMHILTIVFFSIGLFSIVNDLIINKWFSLAKNKIQNVKTSSNYQSWLANFLGYTSFFFAIILIFQAGTDLLYLSKTDLNARYSLTYSLFLSLPAGIGLVYGVYAKKRALILICSLPLFLYILIGFRSVAIVAIVASLMVFSGSIKIISRKTIKISLVLILVFLSFATYKQAYVPIKEGTFDFFATEVSEDKRFDSTAEFLVWAAFSAEFGQISSNLELTTSRDLSQYHSFSSVILGSLPLIDDVGQRHNERFSDTIKEYANPGFSYGLGGSFWGELFVLGGILAVSLSAFIIGFVLIFLNYLIFHRNLYILLYLATNFVFLHPKMDIYAIFGLVKNIFILLCIPMAIYFIYCELLKKDFHEGIYNHK
mgnify:FL=1